MLGPGLCFSPVPAILLQSKDLSGPLHRVGNTSCLESLLQVIIISRILMAGRLDEVSFPGKL